MSESVSRAVVLEAMARAMYEGEGWRMKPWERAEPLARDWWLARAGEALTAAEPLLGTDRLREALRVLVDHPTDLPTRMAAQRLLDAERPRAALQEDER